ncbi:MAG: hypothetical protein JWM68_1849 [Verrucomicrobiales bacterium]|nr:hypothetical protein [Verrucomicrobiales bacterium]
MEETLALRLWFQPVEESFVFQTLGFACDGHNKQLKRSQLGMLEVECLLHKGLIDWPTEHQGKGLVLRGRRGVNNDRAQHQFGNAIGIHVHAKGGFYEFRELVESQLIQ